MRIRCHIYRAYERVRFYVLLRGPEVPKCYTYIHIYIMYAHKLGYNIFSAGRFDRVNRRLTQTIKFITKINSLQIAIMKALEMNVAEIKGEHNTRIPSQTSGNNFLLLEANNFSICSSNTSHRRLDYSRPTDKAHNHIISNISFSYLVCVTSNVSIQTIHSAPFSVRDFSFCSAFGAPRHARQPNTATPTYK